MTSYLRDQEFKLIRTSGPSHTALQCADALGAPLETVIKSVVFVASSRPAAATPAGVLVLAQGGSTVSRLALSRQLGGDWRLATPAEALALTGFEVGSIPPFGTLPTLADERILDQELVCCGAGDRDMHVMLSPADLFRATGATVGAFAFTAAIDATRISDGGEAAGGGLNGAGTGSFAISPPGTVALRAADALADRGCVGDTTGGAENIGAMKTGGGVETRGGLPVRGFVPDTGGVAVPAPLRPSASEVLSGSWTAAASASLSGFGLGSISKLASAFISKLASAFIPTGASPSIPGVGPGPISGLASTSIPGAVPAPDLGLSTCVLTLGAARANLSADAIEAELKRMAAEVAARAEAAGDAGAKSGGARAEAAGVMGGSSGGSGDASRDASVDASRDASRDASVDASRDASRDASVDVSVAWFGDESGDAPAAASGILQRLENGPSIAGVGSARLEQKTSPCIVAGVNTPPIKTPPNIAGMDTPSSIAGVGSARLESLGPHTVAGVDATPIVAGMDTPPSIAVKAPPGMSGVKSPASSSVDTLPSSPGAATPPIAAGVETDERILRHAVSSLPPLRPVVRASMRSVVAEGVCIPRALVVRVRRQARRLLFVSIQPLDPPVVSAAGGEDDAGVEAAADGQAVGQADGQARVWAAHQGVSGNEALHAVDGAMSAADTAYPTEPGVGRGVSEGQQLRASAAVSARESAYPAEESRNAEGAAAHEGVTRNGEEREAGGQLKNKGESSSWGQDVGPSRPTLPEVLESAHLCWQVIAGRTLVQNLGETSAAELLKLVRPGAVLYVEGRVQLNPRGGTHVDLVASEARVLQLAPRGGGGAAGGGVGEGGGQTMAGAVSTGEEVGSQMSAAVANGAATAMSSGVSSYAGVGSGLDATLLVGVDSCAGAVGSSGQVTDARAMPHSPPVGSTLTSPVMPTAHSASSNQGTMPTAVAGQLAEAFSRVGAAGAFNAPATSGTGEAAATPASGRLPGSTGRPPSPTSGLPRLTLPLPVTLVQDAAGVHALAEALAALPPGAQIGMDLEWRPRGLFGFPSGANRNGIENLIGSTTDFGAGPNAPALLQLATSSRVFVVDFLAVCCSGQEGAAAALYTALSRAFRSPELTKLGFAMRGDLQQLERVNGLAGVSYGASSMRDLQREAALRLGISTKRPLGLKALTAMLLGASMDKTQQVSDWAARPLSEEQLTYAATDAWVLLPLARAIDRLPPPPAGGHLTPAPSRRGMAASGSGAVGGGGGAPANDWGEEGGKVAAAAPTDASLPASPPKRKRGSTDEWQVEGQLSNALPLSRALVESASAVGQMPPACEPGRFLCPLGSRQAAMQLCGGEAEAEVRPCGNGGVTRFGDGYVLMLNTAGGAGSKYRNDFWRESDGSLCFSWFPSHGQSLGHRSCQLLLYGKAGPGPVEPEAHEGEGAAEAGEAEAGAKGAGRAGAAAEGAAAEGATEPEVAVSTAHTPALKRLLFARRRSAAPFFYCGRLEVAAVIPEGDPREGVARLDATGQGVPCWRVAPPSQAASAGSAVAPPQGPHVVWRLCDGEALLRSSAAADSLFGCGMGGGVWPLIRDEMPEWYSVYE